ncbi:hypothetical protein ACFX1R_029396 [Malus domestica]
MLFLSSFLFPFCALLPPPPNVAFPCLYTDIQTLDNPATTGIFHLRKFNVHCLASKSIFTSRVCLKISIYTSHRATTCDINFEKLLAWVLVLLNLAGSESNSSIFHNG